MSTVGLSVLLNLLGMCKPLSTTPLRGTLNTGPSSGLTPQHELVFLDHGSLYSCIVAQSSTSEAPPTVLIATPGAGPTVWCLRAASVTAWSVALHAVALGSTD